MTFVMPNFLEWDYYKGMNDNYEILSQQITF
jgi:hypothetical protein